MFCFGRSNLPIVGRDATDQRTTFEFAAEKPGSIAACRPEVVVHHTVKKGSVAEGRHLRFGQDNSVRDDPPKVRDSSVTYLREGPLPEGNGAGLFASLPGVCGNPTMAVDRTCKEENGGDHARTGRHLRHQGHRHCWMGRPCAAYTIKRIAFTTASSSSSCPTGIVQHSKAGRERACSPAFTQVHPRAAG